MGKNGYFSGPPETSIPPLSRVSQRWPPPQLVGHCTVQQRFLGSIPSGSKRQLLRYKGGEGLKVFFPFFPHSSPRVYYAKAGDMQPILILSPLLGTRDHRGYVAFPPTCGPPRRQG